MCPQTAQPGVAEFEFDAAALPESIAAAYREHGCAVVRGLMSGFVPRIAADIECAVSTAVSLLPRARRVTEGWTTPDGTLFLPAPEGFHRDKQIMVLAFNYRTSAAFLHSGMSDAVLAIVSAILGPDVELFGDGQCLYKEAEGGHPKHLHQDSAYFEHKLDGPVGILTYVVPTGLENGALHVVPGTHRMPTLTHIDTFSHLGLDPDEWPWERATPVSGDPGDAILFHYRTVHGSRENRSGSARPVFIHRYRAPGDYVTVGATTASNRAEAEKRAAEATAANQRGLMVCGTRRDYEE